MILFISFLPQFCDIQLVVTVLCHRCNSRTDSGEAKVESHASSETQPNQAALLLDTMPTTQKPAAPICRRKHRTPGDRVCVHCAPQESLVCDETRISVPAKLSPNPGDTGQIVRCNMGLPAATEPGLEHRISSGTASTAVQCLRPLRPSGGHFQVNCPDDGGLRHCDVHRSGPAAHALRPNSNWQMVGWTHWTVKCH